MEALRMSVKERRRLEVVSRVRDGEITLVKAAELMGLCYRQARRVYGRYRANGDEGLVHRLRGRPSNRGRDPAERRAVLKIYQGRYGDFGPTLAAEYLERERGLGVDHETLRRWLLAEGFWTKRRRRSRHRTRRPRREHRGELVQMDGSHHDWFEGRRGKAVLMVMVDDATNRTYARFFEAETTRAAFEVFWAYAERHGLPRALYVDRDSIFRSDRQARVDEELRGSGPETQFGRAMRVLGVEVKKAQSPQAKGRVERRNGVFQDRLVKAMRLEDISTLREANAYLEGVFLADMNERFTVKATEEADLHRPVPAGLDLGELLCFEEPRVVRRDWTVRWRNRWFQLDRPNQGLGLVGRKITVREKLDGEIKLCREGRELTCHELVEEPRPAQPETQNATKKTSAKPRWRPPADHPWRRGFKAAALSKPSSATPRQALTAP